MTGEHTRRTDDVSGLARPQAPEDESAEPQSEPGDDEAPASEPEPIEPPPPAVADLAAACVRFVATRYGAVLDFSPDTLSFVDQWVRDASVEAQRRAELVELVQSSAGAYLGEVIRRSFGGAWIAEGNDMADWKLCLSTVYCAFNPVGMVREALLAEEAEGWHAHFEVDPGEREAVEQRLSSLPVVDAREYFSPSTRFDVVEILVDALRASMNARGLSDVRFAIEDYR